MRLRDSQSESRSALNHTCVAREQADAKHLRDGTRKAGII